MSDSQTCKACGGSEETGCVFSSRTMYNCQAKRRITIRLKTCDACVSKKSGVTYSRRCRERAALVTEIRCQTCRKGKKACDENFDRLPSGSFRNICRTCRRLERAAYRRTQKYRRYVARKKEVRREAQRVNARRRAAKHVHYKKSPPSPEARKARTRLTQALKTGLVARPPRCQFTGCKTRRCGRRHLRAHFHRGYAHPLDVAFYCYPHYEWVVRGRDRAIEVRSSRLADWKAQQREDLFAARQAEARRLAGLQHRSKKAALANLRPPSANEYDRVRRENAKKIRVEREAERDDRSLDERLRAAGSALTAREVMTSPFVRQWLNRVPRFDLSAYASARARD